LVRKVSDCPNPTFCNPRASRVISIILFVIVGVGKIF
jgi:hypothetical protein